MFTYEAIFLFWALFFFGVGTYKAMKSENDSAILAISAATLFIAVACYIAIKGL